MKHYYPAYYPSFRCIAAACPDSCCQGWDVVIDEKAEDNYNAVQGAFGDRLRKAICTDSDGDRIFRLAEQKKCPFWGNDRLCEIYKTLGKEHLCATCALFPRIRMEYADFTEHTLALACPEAARLILTTDNAYGSFQHTEAAGCEDYSAEEMCFLLQTRRDAASLLSEAIPLFQRLNALMRLAKDAQMKLTGTSKEPAAQPLCKLYGSLEYIDESSRKRISDAVSRSPDLCRYEKELTNLALYYLYRYLLSAADTLDLLAPLSFLCVSVRAVAALAEHSGDIVRAAQLYSKEIEQSYENTEALWRALGAD